MPRILSVSILALVSTLLIGCQSKPTAGAYDLVVTLDPTLKNPDTKRFPPVTCQVVGVANKDERDRLLSNSVASQLGKNADDLNASNVKTFDPSQSATGSMVISKTDPIWAKWKSPQFIVITTNIPDVKAGPGGNMQDPRRVWFSTNTLRWKGAEGTISLRVMRDRIVKETQETQLKPEQITPDEF